MRIVLIVLILLSVSIAEAQYGRRGRSYNRGYSSRSQSMHDFGRPAWWNNHMAKYQAERYGVHGPTVYSSRSAYSSRGSYYNRSTLIVPHRYTYKGGTYFFVNPPGSQYRSVDGFSPGPRIYINPYIK